MYLHTQGNTYGLSRASDTPITHASSKSIVPSSGFLYPAVYSPKNAKVEVGETSPGQTDSEDRHPCLFIFGLQRCIYCIRVTYN
jgi:hypothetical protein